MTKWKLALLLLLAALLAPQSIAARTPHPSTARVPTALHIERSTLDGLATQTHDSAATPAPAELRTKIEPALLKQMSGASSGDPLRAIVYLREQAQLDQTELALLPTIDRRTAVVAELRSTAENSQQGILDWLQAAHLHGVVSGYKPLWIVNAVSVEAQSETIWDLAARPDVGLIRQDSIHALDDDLSSLQVLSSTLTSGSVQWNVARVGADRVWNELGITGRGIVVANLDSGVDWQHPALLSQYRGYSDKGWPTHTGNWFCSTDEGYVYPGDGLGHGTQTMGIMVGQNGVGVAPGAQWIAAKVFDNQGIGYDSWIHEGFQWVLAPGGDPALAPDVVNCSWGSTIGAREEFLPDVQALRSAGIVPIFSAGNSGPAEETIHSPGSYAESIAVGATDQDDLIARFSGRGPSPWDEVKPELCAPGVGIWSTRPGGSLGEGSGTSMAAPHVAGLVALILEAKPALSIDDVESAFTASARAMGEGQPNNTYGWGVVDGFAAVAHAASLGHLAGRVTDILSDAPISGANVEVQTRQGVVATTTDLQGRYALPLSSGRYDVSYGAFGYGGTVVHHVPITVATTTTLNVALRAGPTGVVQGTVRDAATGDPLYADVHVPGAPARTTSDPQSGAYTLPLPIGPHTLRVESEAHRVVTAEVTIENGQTTHQDFSLQGAPTILLVDSGGWYNASQRHYYEQALQDSGYLYDLHVIASLGQEQSDVPQVEDLQPYDLVIWSCPNDSPGYLGAGEALAAYIEVGGRVLLSGQDIAFWDGGGSPWFYSPYLDTHLKTRLAADEAPSRVLNGAGALFAGMTITLTGAGGADNQHSPDVIEPTEPDHVEPAWRYQGDGVGAHATGLCLPHRAMLLSFGLEGVSERQSRGEVLRRSIDWLFGPPAAAGIELLAPQQLRIGRPGESITYPLRLRNTGEIAEDAYTVALDSVTWPASLDRAPSIALDACQSATLAVSVTIPSGTGTHVFETITVTARSVASPTLAATAVLTAKTPAPVLLVDGSRFYSLDARYRAALEDNGLLYDYHRIKAGWSIEVPEAAQLSMYPVVVWYTAYDWFDPLDAASQQQLIAYLDGGGRLLLSSQDMLYYEFDRTLVSDYLGVLSYSESTSPTVAYGEPLHPIGWGLGPYTLTYPYRNWSDSLVPGREAQVAMRDLRADPIALTREGGAWRTAFFSFPLETLDPAAVRRVVGRTVGWLSWLGASTCEADRRTVSAGDAVTMTCTLPNDGAADVSTAHLQVTLPAHVELVTGTMSSGLTYYPAARLLAWSGHIPHAASIPVHFVLQTEALPGELGEVPLIARIGYADHNITFERPYLLHIDRPDLSSSTLDLAPALARPRQALSATLVLRNIGVRDTDVQAVASAPYCAMLGLMDSGGVGASEISSQTVTWTGPVAAGQEVTLTYPLTLCPASGYVLVHQAQIADLWGETWMPRAYADVRGFRSLLPWIAHNP